MQPSLLAEPTDRNIKAVEVAEFGDLAKIVEIAFAANSAMHMPRSAAREPTPRLKLRQRMEAFLRASGP
jgi:hypothetical protein